MALTQGRRLGIENEAKISEQIKHLEMTRIIIAHRPETIKQADRVVVMHLGKVYTPEQIQQLTGTHE
jgi:ATP-binding cassette subfamily B protein RaxB